MGLYTNPVVICSSTLCLISIRLLGFASLFLCCRLHTPDDQETINKARPLLPSTYRCGPAPRHGLTGTSSPQSVTITTFKAPHVDRRIDAQRLGLTMLIQLGFAPRTWTRALSDTCPFASQEAQLATLVFVVGCSQLMSQTLQVLVFWAGREALSPSTEF